MKKSETKILSKKYIVYAVFAGLVVLLAGYKLSGSFSFGTKHLIVESDLGTENKKMVEEFVKLSLKDDFVPKVIKLEEMPANATSEANLVTEHYASWEAGEEIFSLLYVIKKGEKKPDFIRLWALSIDDGVSKERSLELFKSYFKESYIQMFESIECTEVESMVPSEKAVECGQMKMAKPADLLGATVKGSVPISEGFFGQSVSVCLIPDGILRGYPFKNCI